MAADPRLQKLTEENRRLAEELAEAREILRALRSGEVDALVSSGNDAVYAVQLIALAVDRAETYAESLALLLKRLCHVTGGVYAEAWTASESRRSVEQTTAWFGANSDAIRLRESLPHLPKNPADDALLQALRSGGTQWIGLDDLNAGPYRDALERCGVQAGLALPLVVDGKVTAVLRVWRTERDADSDAVLQHVRSILDETAPFVQRKREAEMRGHTLEVLKDMVHDRSRRLAELSGMLEQQNLKREQAETTSRTHQEASLQSKHAMDKQAALLQSVLDSMADGVIVTDLSGNTLQFNPAARKILGDPAGDVRWERWPEVYGLHRRDTVDLLAAGDVPLARAARGESTDRVEIFVQSGARPQGRTIAMSARPLVDPAGSRYGVVAVFQDVTQHRRDEERRLRRVVEQRDLLVREVHHRIKNNLAGVVALLHKHTSDHPETKDLNARLEAQLYTVASMHGLEAAANGGITVGSLIRSLRENTGSLFGRDVNVDCAEEGLMRLRLREADSVPLALALNELLVNAHKHGKAGPLQMRAMRDGKDLVIEIVNEVEPGAAVPDLQAASENGSGLGLVRELLPHDRASLEFERAGSRVSAVVRLPVEIFDTLN